MACMHEETFNIYNRDQDIMPDGYVAIDDLIAPAIQVLNRKGYLTAGCCSGHPFSDSISYDGTKTKFKVLYGQRMYYSHVVFKEGVSLPSMPPGFTASFKSVYAPDMETETGRVIVIEKEINNGSNFLKNFRIILETMEQLYEWALGLPDFVK